METIFVLSIVVFAMLAAGAMAFMYVMFLNTMEHSRLVWADSEGMKADAWEKMNQERRIYQNMMAQLFKSHEAIMRERHEELTKIQASIEKARIHLITDISTLTGRMAKDAAERRLATDSGEETQKVIRPT